MTRDKWFGKEMEYDQAKELAGKLENLCRDNRHYANLIITEDDREDYAEAIRVVLEYLP